MKKSLLATVAAVALIAGAGFASAAENAKDHGGGAAVRSEPEMKKGPDIKAGAPTKGRAETTGAGSESRSEMKAEPKADMKSEGRSRRPSTTGAGPADNGKTEMRSGSDTRAGSDKSRSQDVDSKAASDNKAGATNSRTNAAATDSKSGAGASVNLTSDQKTKIRTSVIQSGNAPKVSRSSINFNISVGTVVPRSVHFVSVPSTLIEIHPAWRGFEYFVVDEEIVIIDPHTLRIVAVLEV
jgi:opacity protein-like surface antigen